MPSYCAETMENNTLFRVPPTACTVSIEYGCPRFVLLMAFSLLSIAFFQGIGPI